MHYLPCLSLQYVLIAGALAFGLIAFSWELLEDEHLLLGVLGENLHFLHLLLLQWHADHTH